MNLDTESTARTLVADGKGILAADETPGTLTKRFDALGIRSTAESRRAYRELLFTDPDAATEVYPFLAAMMGLSLCGLLADRLRAMERDALASLILESVRNAPSRRRRPRRPS